MIQSSETIRYKRIGVTRGHTNLVNALAFKSGNGRELVTGGFDCSCYLWDTSTGKPKASITLSHLDTFEQLDTGGKEGEEGGKSGGIQSSGASQMFNPPYVQALNFVCKDKGVACGLGDGSIRVLNAKDLTQVSAVPGAHNGMITCMYTTHIEWGGNGGGMNFIVSGGK